ncbi:hypothetical protein PAMA_015830 [Pampus argenteus]
METWAGFCPGLHLSLGIWVMITAHTLQNARAEITCASCPSPVQLHLEELQLGMRTDPREPSPLKNIRVEFRELGVTNQNSGVDDDPETGVSAEDVHHFPQDVSLDDGVSTTYNAPGSGEKSHRGTDKKQEAELGEDASLRRSRRSGPEFSEGGWTGRSGGDAGTSQDRGSLLDGHRQGRSEFRWNRDEGRGDNRQDEPKITSSTFALTGDSAHNHAVVYWSGQNSSSVGRGRNYHMTVRVWARLEWSLKSRELTQRQWKYDRVASTHVPQQNMNGKPASTALQS